MTKPMTAAIMPNVVSQAALLLDNPVLENHRPRQEAHYANKIKIRSLF